MTASTTFREENPPLPIATTFFLRDFDSGDLTTDSVTLTVDLAVDQDSESLQLDTSGTNISFSGPMRDEFTQEYSLTGGNSFTEYQQVNHLCSTSSITSLIVTFFKPSEGLVVNAI